MSEKIVKNKNVEIYTESFGNSEDPCILLIMGASASMVWWDEEFCRMISERKRFVIRYDNRDVGKSTCYEPGKPQYGVMEMAYDAIAILDAYGIRKAHLVGMSLGGMISQIVVITNPERCLTITVISSSIWDDIPELPQIDKRIIEYHNSASSIDWTDNEAVIKYMVDGWKLLNGSAHKFDEKRAHKLAETEIKRARNLLSMFNHALLKGGEELYGRSNEIKIPYLIIHGSEDIVLPIEHAVAMNKIIPNSQLIILKGSGHEIHYAEWNKMIELIVEHTNR